MKTNKAGHKNYWIGTFSNILKSKEVKRSSDQNDRMSTKYFVLLTSFHDINTPARLNKSTSHMKLGLGLGTENQKIITTPKLQEDNDATHNMLNHWTRDSLAKE